LTNKYAGEKIQERAAYVNLALKFYDAEYLTTEVRQDMLDFLKMGTDTVIEPSVGYVPMRLRLVALTAEVLSEIGTNDSLVAIARQVR